MLTPDSSRFWPEDTYEPGRGQPSFDKQYVRDWLDESGWDHEPPPPELPAEVVEQTAARYREAYERITGEPFKVLPRPDGGDVGAVRFRVQVVVDAEGRAARPAGQDRRGRAPDARVGRTSPTSGSARTSSWWSRLADDAAARAQVAEMAERFLSNPVIEDYRIVAVEAPAAAGEGR